MALPTYTSPTLDLPRISAKKFRELLLTKNSPVVPVSTEVYANLVNNGVEPSFALAQFRVESQYGTSGYAKETGSWGNMLFDSNLTTRSGPTITKTTSDGKRYTYATYDNYLDAVEDYSVYLHWYITKYNLGTIYGATARWTGKVPESAGHVSYVNAVLADMVKYETIPGQFYEVGDKMIYAGPAVDRNSGRIVQKYPVVENKTVLYRGTDGTVLKTYQGPSGDAWWLGPVNGSWTWGAILIGTSSADPDATVVYIKNPVKTEVKTIA